MHADTGHKLQVMFISNIGIKKKCDLCYFNHGVDIGAKWTGSNIPGTADLLGPTIIHDG